MDTKNKILQRCSLVLMLTGNRLFAQTRCQRIIRSLFRLWLAYIMIVFWYRTVRDSIKFKLQIGILAMNAFAIGLSVSNLYIMRKSKQLEDLIIKLVKPIDESSLRSVSKMLTLLNAFYAFQLVLAAVVYNSTREPPSRSVWGKIRLLEMSARSISAYWILASSLFYLIVEELLFLYRMQVLRTLRSHLKRTSVHSSVVNSAVESIRASVNQFEDSLSLLPLLWFAVDVVSSAVLAVNIGEGEAMLMVYSVIDYVPPAIVVLCVSNHYAKFQNFVTETCETVTNNISIPDSQQLVILWQLHSLRDLKMTGYSFFTIDLPFLASYVASVFTFGALIMSMVK